MLPLDETRITLSQAASRRPGARGCDRIHPATLTRWLLRGVKSLSGQLVRLEAERLGCRWVTSEAALSRFTEALSTQPIQQSPPRSPSQRQRAAEAAGKRLAEAGA